MSIAYVITFTVRDGHRDRFLSLLTGVLDAMREEDSFISAMLHEDPDNPHRFLLHEVWRDHQDVLEVQLARPYRSAWHAALSDLLEEPRDIGMWTPVREGRRA